MNDILKTYMERFRENRHTLRRYTAFVLALAMITTLFVNWQLHGVGISMTAQYQCGEEEHTHTADCYTKVLTCGYEEGELENADEVAAAAATSQPTVEAEPAPLALEPQIEFVPHEHTEDCYTEVQTLTCMEEEHVHGDDCFDPEDGTLICEKFEHTHDENCYTTEYELTCGLEEGELVEQVVEPTQSAELAAMAVAEPVALEPTVDTVEPIYHHHTDACYEEVLTCPLPEHHHTVACLSDTSADVETPEEWQAANAEAVMTGNWDEDLLSVAKTQLGYEQSEKNFEIDPADGVTLHYYSRYGQSYGNPYGEWDVMFLSYCLKYAGIPQSAIPQEASVLALRSSMSDMDWLLDGEDGSAANVGDIVIYNKYVTRTVAVDSSADGAADDLDDLFSMDAEGENGAELETSGASALDTAPAAEDAPAADSMITPDLPDTANPEQPAAKPVDSTGTSASGADTLIPSVASPAAEPQTTTVTDAQPVETVGIVSEADENTLTVISGDVDGKVAEVTISNAEVLAVVDVAAAQYADEMLSSAVDGALKAPGMLTLAGEGSDTLTSVKYVDHFDETPEGSNKGGITGTTVTVNNKIVTGEYNLQNNDKIKLDYDFYIPADVLDLTTGKDTLTYHLPDGVVPEDSDTYDLDDGVGTMTVAKDGTITLKFNNNFAPHQPFTGHFTLSAKVKTDKIGDGGTITFPGSSASITVKNPTNISIDKKGTYDEKDGKRILHYTVTVSSTDGWNQKVDINDKLDNTGKVTGTYVRSSIKLTDKNKKEISLDGHLTWSETEQSFSIKNLPEMNKKDKYILTYDVELSGSYGGSGSGSFHNYAETNNEQKTDPWTWHSNYIEKHGSYNNEDGYMYWTVTLSNYYGGNLKNYKVEDALQTNGATIVGDVTITEKSKDGTVSPFGTINGVDGKDKFDYTFTKDATGTEYTFYYKTTVPDGVKTVKNKSTVDTGKEKYEATAEPGITDRSWSTSKSTAGSLTETSTPNLLKAPWKIEVVVPNKWESYGILDKIYSPKDLDGIHYGIASELQSDLENHLTFTLVDNTTMTYAQAIAAGIQIEIKYADIQDGFDKKNGEMLSKAKEILSTDSTTPVRSFYIKLTKTDSYKGKNIKKLTIDSYSTYVDVTKVESGNEIKIKNKANNAEANYTYTKPKEHTKFEKGVSTNAFGEWAAGDFKDKLDDVDYKESGRTLYYQLTLDTSDLTRFDGEEYTVTDTLPAGLKYVEGSARGAFRRASDKAAYYNFYRDSGGPFSFNNPTYPSEFFEVNATTYSSTEGQTLTFKIKNLQSLNNNTQHDFFTECSGFYIRYTVEVDTELWKNWKGNGVENDSKDERTYINTAHWGKLDAKAEVTLKRKSKNLDKDVKQLTDRFDHKIGSAAYTIKINPGAKDLVPNSDTVTLTDTLTVQQGYTAELDLSSVQLYDAADTAFSNPLSRNEYTFHYTSHVDAASVNTYTMELTVPDQRALVLKYTYKTNAGVGNKVTLDNTALLNGKWDADSNQTLKDITAGGYVSQTKLVVHKVDSSNQANGLKGAKFSLHWLDKTTGKWKTTEMQNHESDENGQFTIWLAHEELHADVDTLYKLVEEKAPDGYRQTSKPYYFIFAGEDETDADAYNKALNGKTTDVSGNTLPLLKDSNLMICIYNEQSDLYISNERSQLIIQKFWTNQYNEQTEPKEESVTVDLYKYKKDTERATGEKVTSITLNNRNNWTATYNDLDEGYLYYIKEASTDNKYEVTYSSSNETGVENGGVLTLTNKEKPETPGYELPSTGGTGTLPYTAVGGTMMLSALAYSFIHRKRRREGRADD